MIDDFQPGEALYGIRAISFDLDNTLWEVESVIRKAEAELWHWLATNYPQIPERFKAEDMLALRQVVMQQNPHKSHDFRYLRKKVLEQVAADCGCDPELVEPAFRVFDTARNAVELYPEVQEELQYLYERFTIIAVTNGNANLETIGIRHLFHGVVTASETGVSKPAPRIFAAAARLAGFLPGEILHVGDHPEHDVHGAREAGFRVAWVNRTDIEWPQHLELPEVVLSTLAGLRTLLNRAHA